MNEKLCIFCDHFWFDSIDYYDYGGETGGGVTGGDLKCSKGHEGDWPSLLYMDVDDFRKAILKAHDCPDYSPPSQSEEKKT